MNSASMERKRLPLPLPSKNSSPKPQGKCISVKVQDSYFYLTPNDQSTEHAGAFRDRLSNEISRQSRTANYAGEQGQDRNNPPVIRSSSITVKADRPKLPDLSPQYIPSGKSSNKTSLNQKSSQDSLKQRSVCIGGSPPTPSEDQTISHPQAFSFQAPHYEKDRLRMQNRTLDNIKVRDFDKESNASRSIAESSDRDPRELMSSANSNYQSTSSTAWILQEMKKTSEAHELLLMTLREEVEMKKRRQAERRVLTKPGLRQSHVNHQPQYQSKTYMKKVSSGAKKTIDHLEKKKQLLESELSELDEACTELQNAIKDSKKVILAKDAELKELTEFADSLTVASPNFSMQNISSMHSGSEVSLPSLNMENSFRVSPLPDFTRKKQSDASTSLHEMESSTQVFMKGSFHHKVPTLSPKPQVKPLQLPAQTPPLSTRNQSPFRDTMSSSRLPAKHIKDLEELYSLRMRRQNLKETARNLEARDLTHSREYNNVSEDIAELDYLISIKQTIVDSEFSG